MKYFITASFEMDGHSAAMCMICNSAEAKKQYLDALLYDEEMERYYPTSFTNKEDNGSETWYGEWPCGQWSINILPFKTFKEICNKEMYSRTG